MAKGGNLFAERLQAMNEGLWDVAKKTALGLPNGQYEAQLASASLILSKQDKLLAAFEFTVLAGEFEGVPARDILSIESDVGARMLAERIVRLGYEVPDDMADIEPLLAELSQKAPTVLVNVNTNQQGFTNLRVLRLLAENEAAETAEVAEASTEEEESEEAKDKTSEEPTEESAEAEVEADAEKASTEEAEAEAEEGASDAVDEAELLDTLVAFCQAQDIEVDGNDDAESLKEKINNFKYKAEELTPEETKLLKSIGAEIIKSVPIPTKVAPKAAAPKVPVKVAPKAVMRKK